MRVGRGTAARAEGGGATAAVGEVVTAGEEAAGGPLTGGIGTAGTAAGDGGTTGAQ